MTRRDVLRGALAASALRVSQADPKPFKNLGGAPAGFPARLRAARESGKPFDFMEHCHSLGLAVVEVWRFDTSNAEAVRNLRTKLDSYNMRAIADIPLPRDENGVAVFDYAVKGAKEAGVRSLHAALTQRRYEQFDTLAAFQKDFERCQRMVALAEPVLRKYQMPLGIENHKGWRAAEQASWMKRTGSDWVRVHFDFGNNISLCEDPGETLRILKPYVISCHIKDMAVEPYDEGFLLSEVPLGEGFLDVKGMVASLQEKDPAMPFDLEMITRDPLKIPIFTDKYWATFDDTYSPLPGRDLARVVEIVNRNHPKAPLPHTTGLSTEAFLRLEDEFVNRSIEWARQNLNV